MFDTITPAIDAGPSAALHRHLYDMFIADPDFANEFFPQFAPYWEALALELNIDPHSVKIQTKHEQSRLAYAKQLIYMLGPVRTESGKTPLTVGNFITAMISLELQDPAMRIFPSEFATLRPDMVPGSATAAAAEASGSGSCSTPAGEELAHKPSDMWRPSVKEKYQIALKLAPNWTAVACGFNIAPDEINSHVGQGSAAVTKSQYMVNMIAGKGVTRQQFSEVLREKYVGLNLYARTFFPECEPKK